MRKVESNRRLIPVHIVTGPPGCGKSALIRSLVRQRIDWFGLVNALPVTGETNLRQLSSGCPCCTGKLVMQVSLVRGLRETHASRALIELTDGGHRATLSKLLDDLPLSLSVVAARVIVMPGDAGVVPGDLDA